MNNKQIIVSGATENLGTYSAIQLKQDGYNVIGVCNRQSDNNLFSDYSIKYYSVNICDPKSFERLSDNEIDTVVHFVGTLLSRYEYKPRLLIESIIRGILNVLEYMRKARAKKRTVPQTHFDMWYFHKTETLIKTDNKRYFPPTGNHTIYTIAKNAAADLIEYYHKEYNIFRFMLRFFTIYQYHPKPYHYMNGIRKMIHYKILIERAINGEDIEILGDPKRRKEMVYTKDFVRLVSLSTASDIEGGTYNVEGNRVSLEEQIQRFIEVFSPSNHPSSKYIVLKKLFFIT